MKCRDARELITAYIDNGLDPLRDRLIAEHLEQCRKCRAEFEFLISWQKSIKGIRPVKAPPGFMAELRRRLEAERRHPLKRYLDPLIRFRENFRFPVEAAALVIIGSVIFALYRPDRMFSPRVTAPVTEYQESTAADTEPAPDRALAPEKAGSEERAGSAYKLRQRRDAVTDKSISVSRDGGAAGDSYAGTEADDVSEKLKAEEGTVRKSFDRDATVLESEAIEKRSSDRKEEAGVESFSRNSKIADAASVTPEDIFRKYKAVIVSSVRQDDGSYLYTVDTDAESADRLVAGLKKHFDVTVRSRTEEGEKIRLVIRLVKAGD